jgi:hypothetical protein
MKLAQVRINRTEHLAPVINVGEWEIPVLQYIYTPEKVEILGRMKDKRPYPDAHNEFTRLELRYGIDTNDGKSHAASAYGQGIMGVRTIQQMIEAEQAAELELGDSLPLWNPELNVVYNPDQETIDAARDAQKNPTELLPRSNTNDALLAQVLDQNRQLLALLAERQAPAAVATPAPAEAPASDAKQPVLSLPKAQAGK